ncbi:MAG: glycosyltransferase family 4 protein [Anaerolineales bacterium]|jgi:glycosyltransferase involved in cell wall biosynthesis
MRVLQVHPLLRGDLVYPLAGGKSRVSLALSEYLALNGHAVGLFPYPERLFRPPRGFRGPSGGRLVVLPTATLPTRTEIVPGLLALLRARLASRGARGQNGGFDLLALTALEHGIKEFRPAIVHCHHTFSDFPYLFRSLRGRMPLVLTHHAYQAATHLDVYDWVIFVSRAWQEKVVRDSHFPLERTRVIYNPVSADFSTGEVKPHGQRHGIVFSGNLSSRKGLHLLLQAYQLEPALRAYPLTVCGTGEAEGGYRELARRDHLPVTFCGRLRADQLRIKLGDAAALVNPSSGEGFSVALLEAVCCGTPVVGWPLQLEEMQEVMSMPVGAAFDAAHRTPQDLAASVLQLLVENQGARPSPQSLADRARDVFSLTRAGRALLRLYQDAISA